MAQSNPRSIAFAKTTRPVVGSAVPRERLFARMDGSPGRTVAWISGPPGAGKTTLAASYVEARRLRSLWYQVDADDADIATFFHYLAHAARKLDGGRAREFPSFAGEDEDALAAFARRFFRHLFSRAKGPFALVLDNLHAVPADGALHRVIEAIVGQVPKQCCLLVTSRSDPPVGLARFRVTGELVCLDAATLRVEAAEAGEIARARGQVLPPETVAQLQERTQGWAAGLVLMLEHAKLAGRLADLPGDAPPPIVFDYLAGEIFRHFEPATRRFLMQVACLPRMTVPVACALSGEPQAGRMLINLALNNYFVSEAQFDGGRIYQLHPLMRDFLLGRAAIELPAVRAADHLRKAAGLLRDAGQVEDAVSLLLDCRDWDEIARLARAQAATMLAQGRSATLGAWLALLPPPVLEADPALLFVLGECRLRASPREARRRFEQALAGYRAAGDVAGALRACCGLIDATVLEFDDLAPLDRWAAELAGLLQQVSASSLPGGDAGRAAAGAIARALLIRDAGNVALPGWIERAGAPLLRVAAALLRGDLGAATAASDALRGEGDVHRSPLAGAIAVAAALRQLMDGAHASALETARASLALAEVEGAHGQDCWLRAIAAAAALGSGQRDAARAEIQRIEAMELRLRRGDRAVLHFLRGWLAALDGEADGALRESRTAVALASETGLPWLECLARGALARGLAGVRDRKGVEAQMRAADALAEAQQGAWLRFSTGLAAAEALLAFGDETAALAPLRAAFALGREHGFRHAPWWRPREMAELCVLALREAVEVDYARGLARERRLVPREAPLRLREWPWPVRILTLGGFELRHGDLPVEFSGKGPGRPMELLKVLIAMGGQSVRADQLADALWPHVDADYAHKSFTATLHRLRRLVGEDDALTLRDGRLGLDPGLVWVDAWALERTVADFDELLRGPGGARALPALQSVVEDALAFYRGPYLPDESEQPSYLAFREQLRSRMLRSVARLARALEDAGEPEAAADAYQRLIDADPLFEAPYRNLMLACQRRGDPMEARATYERLRTVLATRLKAMPSAETQAVYAGLAARPA